MKIDLHELAVQLWQIAQHWNKDAGLKRIENHGALQLLAQGFERYEKIRRLNPTQFKILFDRCLGSGKRFDDEVDKLLENCVSKDDSESIRSAIRDEES